MPGRNLLCAASLAVVALTLSACGGGGGGVGSTPTPTPTPTPSPTPTPTPTPTPPPSSANADLINLTQSESFTNDGVTGSASYSKTGGPTSATSGSATLSFVYDAATRTYTMTNGGRSQSFAPGNIDNAQSNSAITVYSKTSGTTTDTLTLTKPGTSGTFNYRYVGAAFWQRTVDGTSAVTGTFDAATYGVESPDSAVPRSGGAEYDVVLLGVVARPDDVYSLGGEGKLIIDFLNGTVTGTSLHNGLREINASTGAPGRFGQWSYAGTLASTANAITGTMTLHSTSSDPLTGPGTGRLYGPNGEEVGIAFRGTGGDGAQAVGTLIGRKNGNAVEGNNPSLTNMQFNQTFPNQGWQGLILSTSGPSGPLADWSTNATSVTNPPVFRYNAVTSAYEVAEFDGQPTPTVRISTASNADASLSDSKFDGYSSSSPTEVLKLRIYKPGPANGEIVLTYSSYYNYEKAQSTGGGNWSYSSTWMPFGIYTANSAMPTTGTASYSGIFNGHASDGLIGSEIAKASGAVNLTVNFGNAQVTGDFRPIITYSNGSTYDLGLATLSNGLYANPGVNQFGVSGPPGVTGEFLNGPLYNGILRAFFFGPNFNELTGTIYGKYVPQGESGISGILWGGFGSKKN